MKMKLIILLILLVWNNSVFSQEKAKIYQPEMLYFFRAMIMF